MRTYVFALFEKKGFGAAKTIYSVASSPWVSIILIHGGKLRRWVVNDELVDLQGTTSKPIVVVMKLENSSNIDTIRWAVFLQNFEILESLTWIKLITQSYDSFFLNTATSNISFNYRQPQANKICQFLDDFI